MNFKWCTIGPDHMGKKNYRCGLGEHKGHRILLVRKFWTKKPSVAMSRSEVMDLMRYARDHKIISIKDLVVLLAEIQKKT